MRNGAKPTTVKPMILYLIGDNSYFIFANIIYLAPSQFEATFNSTVNAINDLDKTFLLK